MENTASFSYDPLWNTMKEKKVSTYKLINTYHFNKGTLYHLKRGDNVNIEKNATFSIRTEIGNNSGIGGNAHFYGKVVLEIML